MFDHKKLIEWREKPNFKTLHYFFLVLGFIRYLSKQNDYIAL